MRVLLGPFFSCFALLVALQVSPAFVFCFLCHLHYRNLYLEI